MQELEKIEKTGRLRIGIQLQEGIKSAPWAWIDDQTGELYGFEVDIANKLADYFGLKADFIPTEGYRLITSLINDRYDIIISSLKTLNTMKGVILSNPYYYLSQRLVIPETSPVFDLADLRGNTVGVLSKSLGEFIIEEENKNLNQKINLKQFNDVLETFSALHFKETDAIFIDSPVALWYSRTYIDPKLKLGNVAYKSGSYSIGIREENRLLLNRINHFIEETNIQEVLDKYGLWDDVQENQ